MIVNCFIYYLLKKILKQEPNNYNALVFLGLSLFKMGQPKQSEEAYQKAIAVDSIQPLAFQVAVICMIIWKYNNQPSHSWMLSFFNTGAA